MIDIKLTAGSFSCQTLTVAAPKVSASEEPCGLSLALFIQGNTMLAQGGPIEDNLNYEKYVGPKEKWVCFCDSLGIGGVKG